MKNFEWGLIVGCLILAVSPSFSQESNHPGYIVHLNGDTTRGMIQTKRFDRSPTAISFSSETFPEKEYKPGAIRSFFMDGLLYESAIVDIDVSPQSIREMTGDPAPEIKRDTVFLESLFRGEKELLYLKDEKGKEHFYIHDGDYKLLIHKKFMLLFENMSGMISKRMDVNAGFKKQLFSYLNNCPGIQGEIERTRYTSQGLISIFSAYYQCTHERLTYSKDRKPVSLEGGVIAGAAASMVRFKGEKFEHYYILQNKHSTSVSPSLGLFLNVRLLRSRGLSLSNDLFYTSFDIQGEGSGASGYGTRSDFSYQYLKMHNMMRFDLSRVPAIFMGVGLSTGLVLQNKEQIYIEFASGNEDEPAFNSKSHEFGVVGGVGISFGKFAANLRYERSSGISNDPDLAGRVRRFHLLLSYRLFQS